MGVDPVDGRAPLAPPTESKSRSHVDADPPKAGLLDAGGNVGLAIAVEVPGHHVHPCHRRRKRSEHVVIEAIVAVGDRHQDLAGLQGTADDVVTEDDLD